MGHPGNTSRNDRLGSAIRPVIESLEKRQLLSVTLSDGILTIVGTDAADTIDIYPSPRHDDRLVVRHNGKVKSFAERDVQRIEAFGLGGADFIGVSNATRRISVPVTFWGGAGHDTLAGSFGDDILDGGKGHDFLNGGDGNDTLTGGDGHDRLLGGEGDDWIDGQAGDDQISSGLFADNPNDVVVPSEGNDVLNKQMKPNFPISTYTGTIEGYSPHQIRRAYGFGDLDDKTYVNRGKGQAIAIVDAFHSPTAKADLTRFSKQYGLPLPNKKNFVQVYASGKRPTEEEGWNGETLLDIQWAHAIAPEATIILVEADSALWGDLTQAISVATKLLNKWFGGGVISLSIGSTEDPSLTINDAVFNNRNTKNISFVVAAGDTPEPSWPATSPHVLSVGGSTLFLDDYGNRVSGDLVGLDTLENDFMPNNYQDSEFAALGLTPVIPGGERPWMLGGSGPSLIYSEPWYQQNRGTNYLLVPDPATGQLRYPRGTPDISWAADPRPLNRVRLNTNGDGDGTDFWETDDEFSVGSGAVAVYNSYGDGGRAGWFATGGTSAGAPQVAAMIALANQYRSWSKDPKISKQPKIGNKLVDYIYSLGLRGGDAYFHDITDGGTGLLPDSDQNLGRFLYQARPGWDYASGFGSPNAASLIPALAGEKTPIVDTKGIVTGMFTTYNPTVTPGLGRQMSWIQFKGKVTFQGARTITMSPPVITQVFTANSTPGSGSAANRLGLYLYGVDVDDNTRFTTDWSIAFRNETPITLYRNGNHVYGMGRFEIVDRTTTGDNAVNPYGYFKIDGTIKGRNKLDLKIYSVTPDGKAIKNAWTPHRFDPNGQTVTYVRGTIKT